jgi:hypothetical protein
MDALELWVWECRAVIKGSSEDYVQLSGGRGDVHELLKMLLELKAAREAKPYITNLLHMVLNATWEQMKKQAAIRQVEWMELIDERRALIGNVLEMVMESKAHTLMPNTSMVRTDSLETLNRIMQGLEPDGFAGKGDPVALSDDLRAVFAKHGYDPASAEFAGLINSMEAIEKRQQADPPAEPQDTETDNEPDPDTGLN